MSSSYTIQQWRQKVASLENKLAGKDEANARLEEELLESVPDRIKRQEEELHRNQKVCWAKMSNAKTRETSAIKLIHKAEMAGYHERKALVLLLKMADDQHKVLKDDIIKICNDGLAQYPKEHRFTQTEKDQYLLFS